MEPSIGLFFEESTGTEIVDIGLETFKHFHFLCGQCLLFLHGSASFQKK